MQETADPVPLSVPRVNSRERWSGAAAGPWPLLSLELCLPLGFEDVSLRP